MRMVLVALVVGVMLPMAARADGDGVAHLRSIPKLVPQRSLAFRWSLDALKHHSEGTAVLKCGLDPEGRTRDCKVIRGIAHIQPRELVAYAEGLVFTPALGRDGNPVALANFMIPVRLVAPRSNHYPLPHIPMPKP